MQSPGFKPGNEKGKCYNCGIKGQRDRNKWNAKSTKCIFIGYSLVHKGYRLWNPKTKRVHESRDVVFMANEFGNRIQLKNPDVQKKNASTTTEEFLLPEVSSTSTMNLIQKTAMMKI